VNLFITFISGRWGVISDIVTLSAIVGGLSAIFVILSAIALGLSRFIKNYLLKHRRDQDKTSKSARNQFLETLLSRAFLM